MTLLALLPLAIAGPEVSVGGGYVVPNYQQDSSSSPRPGFEVSAILAWPEGWELEVGGRWLLYRYSTAPPMEGFVAGRGGAEFGPWRPAVGLELGVTGALYRDYDAIRQSNYGDEGYGDLETRSLAAPVYVQAFAEPLRFRVWRLNASVAGLGFGTTVPHAGAITRVELTWVRVGVVL